MKTGVEPTPGRRPTMDSIQHSIFIKVLSCQLLQRNEHKIFNTLMRTDNFSRQEEISGTQIRII